MYNHRIQKWPYGAPLGVTVAGNGASGTADSQLNYPRSIDVDNNGYMYIGDESNYRVQRWAPGACSGECLVGCSRTSGSAPDRLANVKSIAFDSQGALYVSDGAQNRVQKFAILTSTGKNRQ